jgi:hypothetical protein
MRRNPQNWFINRPIEQINIAEYGILCTRIWEEESFECCRCDKFIERAVVWKDKSMCLRCVPIHANAISYAGICQSKVDLCNCWSCRKSDLE